VSKNEKKTNAKTVYKNQSAANRRKMYILSLIPVSAQELGMQPKICFGKNWLVRFRQIKAKFGIK